MTTALASAEGAHYDFYQKNGQNVLGAEIVAESETEFTVRLSYVPKPIKILKANLAREPALSAVQPKVIINETSLFQYEFSLHAAAGYAFFTACPVAPDTAIACNDDACGTGGLASQLSFAATANTPYLIRIGGYNAATGAGTLVISGPACPPPGPLNDNCANRSGVGQGNTVYTTVGATTDGPVHAACDNAGSNQITNDISFNHPSQCPGSIRIGLCDANFDSKLAIYDDAGCTNYDARLMVCNDDACGTSGLASQVRIPSRIGRNYTIRIGGFNGATGSGNMTITYCPADFDANGTVEVPDIFAFLSAWFAQDVRANIDGNGVIDVPDIFAFLSLWFAGGGACG